MTTDTTERGLERLICTALTGAPCEPGAPAAPLAAPTTDGEVHDPVPPYGGGGWICGSAADYDREYCIDLVQLQAFLLATQPKAAAAVELESFEPGAPHSPTRRKFLARLQGEITKRGVIDVLRGGVKHGPHARRPVLRHALAGQRRRPASATPRTASASRASSRYSRDETQRALDLGLFINGLPVATFELKNSLTKQTVEDAVEQYKRDRDPRERLFEFGRCVVHFAVDDQRGALLHRSSKGKASWFLPFNQGWNDGAGNPPNPDGLKTDYLWKRDPHPRRA